MRNFWVGGFGFFGGGERTGGGGRGREGGGLFLFPFWGEGGGGWGGGGGDWHWCLKGRGVWVVGLSFPRPFFGFLFRFLGFGVVELAMKLGMDVWVRWE